ncbi:uncharacterized [Tachysurus ichikawai]
MQLQGSGLLERLKILLSLYKGLPVLRAVEERQGRFWSSVSLCERLRRAILTHLIRMGGLLNGQICWADGSPGDSSFRTFQKVQGLFPKQAKLLSKQTHYRFQSSTGRIYLPRVANYGIVTVH